MPTMGEEEGTGVGPIHVDTPSDTGRFEPNSHWKDAPNRECYSSFGDNGTTATVNACGDIMQFSRYIGKGHSGMFSADHRCVSEPYLVERRTANLQHLIRDISYDKKKTYGANFTQLSYLLGAELTYVHNRWPRFDGVLDHDWEDTYRQNCDRFDNVDDLRAYMTSESSGLSRLSTTLMVHDGIVFQRCIASNNSFDKPLEFNVQFEENMLIRDLDHLDPDYSSNKEEDENYVTFLGPQNQSWVRLHQFPGQNPERQVRQVTNTMHGHIELT